MNKTGFLIICLVVLSCNSVTKKQEVKNEKPLMYEPSEMALLMRQMYEVNKIAKSQIMGNDTLISFPENFTTIHSAVLTDSTDRDAEFNSLAEQFLNYQKSTFSSNSDSTVYYFNKSINTCISCHKTRCTGPIPKIKKLLIY